MDGYYLAGTGQFENHEDFRDIDTDISLDMKKTEKSKSLVLMDLTGIYHEETFYRGFRVQWMDLHDLTGTRGYCSEEAGQAIRSRMLSYRRSGAGEVVGSLPEIHFLDSGNYHYLTKFWLEFICEPFDLLVFDHHTDMQPPAFGGLLSCGSWLADVIRNQAFLCDVCLIGSDEKFAAGIDPGCKDRCRMLSVEEYLDELRYAKHSSDDSKIMGQGICERPLFLSIDKDVLSPQVLTTDWDQGAMSAVQLAEILGLVSEKCRICGVDICGEPSVETASGSMIRQSDAINRLILENL